MVDSLETNVCASEKGVLNGDGGDGVQDDAAVKSDEAFVDECN